MQLLHFIFIIALIGNASGKDENNINNTAFSEINPQYLIDVGVKTNDAKLEAIGIAMKNLHSRICNIWTAWSKCTSNIGSYFGIKRRFRKCLNESETDIALCKNLCPPHYERTNNGYCLKAISSPSLRTEAAKQCVLRGGYLVNVDSRKKYEDIKKMKLPNFTKYFHIGGHRKDSRSAWIFQNGTKNEYFKWAPHEPDNGSTALCLFMETFPMVMHDAVCQQIFSYICEVAV